MKITDGPFAVDGFRIGHWTDPEARTGCTVLLADRAVSAVADVRGGAPGTREIAALDHGRLVQRVDAVLLTGGSAFGLVAADGVVRRLREMGRGFPTASIPVPLVPGAVIFDLVGPDPVTPSADGGYEATCNAVPDGWLSGRVGAGAGATVSKAGRPDHIVHAGLGSARLEFAGGAVAALMVVNAVGDIAPRAGTPADEVITDGSEDALLSGPIASVSPGENTTIGIVVVDAPVDRDGLVRIAVAAHDGLARAIRPSHTVVDGDTIFALAAREGRPGVRELLRLEVATQLVVARAVQNSVASPAPVGGDDVSSRRM